MGLPVFVGIIHVLYNLYIRFHRIDGRDNQCEIVAA